MISGFTENLFWGYNIDNLDYVEDYREIIIRCIERGLYKDWIRMFELYDKEVIQYVAHNLEAMNKENFSFLKFLLKDKNENYLCYTKNQFLMN